jgi:hypothetical protein
MIRKIFSIFLLSVFFFPVFVFGQTSSLGDNLNVSIEPLVPKPGENVSVSIESFTTNLNFATISWILDGKLISKSPGKTDFSFSAPVAGKESLLEISVVGQDGRLTKKTIKISPAEVDLIWEADTYTPPFYKGKSIFVPESTVRVVAYPTFFVGSKLADPKSLVYTWKINSKSAGEFSGYGRNSLVFAGSVLVRPAVIEVEVSSGNSNAKAYSSITLTPESPLVLLYEDHPTLGIQYNSALLGLYTLKTKETKFVAEPFFFTATERADAGMRYIWSLNNLTVPEGSEKGKMVFRNEDGKSGSARVGLQAENTNKTFQYADFSALVSFGQGVLDKAFGI